MKYEINVADEGIAELIQDTQIHDVNELLNTALSVYYACVKAKLRGGKVQLVEQDGGIFDVKI